jgi:chromatin segregation and condensation protein Rec8/ScpA/Scc1 (kleisin family)
MVKEGRIEVRQDAAFAPLQVRRTAHQHGGTGQAA